MAQVRTTVLTDDVDGTPAQQTVTFGLDGRLYEIDLTDEHAEQLRAGLSRFIDAARKEIPVSRAAFRSGRTSADYDPKAVRAWAQARGLELPVRGRIPRAIVEQFHAAGY